jgi:hypothetical protein
MNESQRELKYFTEGVASGISVCSSHVQHLLRKFGYNSECKTGFKSQFSPFTVFLAFLHPWNTNMSHCILFFSLGVRSGWT